LVDSLSDFIQWIFSGGELPDLSGLLRGFIDHPVYAAYFAAIAGIGIVLVWGAFRLAFPRVSRIAPPKWNIWLALVVIFGAFAVQLVVYSAVVMIHQSASPGEADLTKIDLLDSALAVIISSPIICVGGYFLLRTIVRARAADIGISPRGAPANFGRGLLLVTMMAPLFLVLAALNSMYLQTVHVDTSEQAVVQTLREAKTPLEMVIISLMALVAAPVWEEFVFRGVLFNGLRKSIGADEAILISAAFFAAIHGSVAAFAPIFFLAALLAYAYQRTGSLLTPIAMHCLFNALNLFQIFNS